MMVAAPVAHAAPGSSAPGLATATIIRPLTVAALADMDFGTITEAPGSAGTVTVSPLVAGASFTGGAQAFCAGSDCRAPHAARFAVDGEPMRSYAVQLPAGVVATGADAPPLAVDRLTLRSVNGGAAPQLDARGHDSFEVGGTITVPPGLAPEHYRATFAVMVSYS